MRNKKEDLVLHYYLSKNKLRNTCIKKCLNFKSGEDFLSDTENDCLTNCSYKIGRFLNIAIDVYKRDLKALEIN